MVFRKYGINHIARIITYVDIKKGKKPKLISLLTNDFDMFLDTIVAIYRRWQIESLFKQIKQNFPVRYFYDESANAIKILFGVTLIANSLLSVVQTSLQHILFLYILDRQYIKWGGVIYFVLIVFINDLCCYFWGKIVNLQADNDE